MCGDLENAGRIALERGVSLMLHTELRQAMKEHPCSMIKEQKRRMVVFTKQLKLVQGQPKHNSRECGQKICTKCPSDDRSTSYPHAYFHHITIWTETIIFSVKYFHHLAIVCLKGLSIFTQGFVHFLLKGNGAYKGFTMHNRKSTEVTQLLTTCTAGHCRLVCHQLLAFPTLFLVQHKDVE